MNIGKLDCPFCESSIREKVILEGNYVFAIYDQYPVSKGHVLVITKRHCCDYFSLTEEEKMEAWKMISEIQIWVKEKHTPDGYNIGINISEAAGQTIAHAHIHLIPRYKLGRLDVLVFNPLVFAP